MCVLVLCIFVGKRLEVGDGLVDLIYLGIEMLVHYVKNTERVPGSDWQRTTCRRGPYLFSVHFLSNNWPDKRATPRRRQCDSCFHCCNTRSTWSERERT